MLPTLIILILIISTVLINVTGLEYDIVRYEYLKTKKFSKILMSNVIEKNKIVIAR
jgi:hypothetical protein